MLIKVIDSRDSRLPEIQPRPACGINEILRVGSGTETIVFAVTGKNMCLGGNQAIGIAIGTGIAIIGGTATAAASSMDPG
jgi:hypothetical protein